MEKIRRMFWFYITYWGKFIRKTYERWLSFIKFLHVFVRIIVIKHHMRQTFNERPPSLG
jgi:hypothetical protein